jgi:aerobic carbon-monoxide dehydrogenase medium subunit
VIPSAFDYTAPTSVDEAIRALHDAGEDGKVMAGGQSLMPVLRLRLAAPSMVVDLSRVDGLSGVREDGDALVIGAMTTHHDVVHDALVRQHAPLLARTAKTVADPQIRHRGTLGGSLAHADPAGDLGAAVLALDAELVIAGMDGRRTVPASEFFVDYFTTSLGAEELLVEIRVPKHTGWGAHYEKFNRTAQAWSIVAVAAAVRMDGGSIAEAKVALTNMGPTPLRATAVEQALAGASSPEDIKAACERADEGTSPPSDANGDEDYRKHLARVLTRRAVINAAGLG